MISPPPAPLASPSTHFFFVHASLFRLPCLPPPLSSLRPPPSFSLSLSLRFQRAPIHPSFLPAWHGPLVHVPWPFLPPPLSLLSSSPVARFALPFPSTTPCSSARLKRLFFSPPPSPPPLPPLSTAYEAYEHAMGATTTCPDHIFLHRENGRENKKSWSCIWTRAFRSSQDTDVMIYLSGGGSWIISFEKRTRQGG